MNSDKFKKFADKGKKEQKQLENLEEKQVQPKDGLIERIDRKLVTKEGKQLLREQLWEGK